MSFLSLFSPSPRRVLSAAVQHSPAFSASITSPGFASLKSQNSFAQSANLCFANSASARSAACLSADSRASTVLSYFQCQYMFFFLSLTTIMQNLHCLGLQINVSGLHSHGVVAVARVLQRNNSRLTIQKSNLFLGTIINIISSNHFLTFRRIIRPNIQHRNGIAQLVSTQVDAKIHHVANVVSAVWRNAVSQAIMCQNNIALFNSINKTKKHTLTQTLRNLT
jgi:hypothetical protein